jgi:hypothetical protein
LIQEQEIMGAEEDSDTEDEGPAVPPPPADPLKRKRQLKRLHVLMQRLTVAEGSFKDIEKRIALCLRCISILRSVSNQSSLWWERNGSKETGSMHPAKSRISGVTPSTLDRDEEMLQSLLLSCQHSRDWATTYSKRVNI